MICFLAGHPLIPCMFHKFTGLYCPGCGTSRMCLSLLRLDFKAAFQDNEAMMLLLLPGLATALWMAVRYVKYGITTPTRAQNMILYTMAAILLLFGILRNLPGFSFLQP